MKKASRQLENSIERVLRPGVFIDYRSGWGFVRGLEAVAAKLDKRAAEGAVEETAHLYETFIGACHEKAEEIDDSSGSFGQFVQDLFVGWVRARRRAKANPAETVSALAAWMDDDPYGFCLDLERRVSGVLDRRHLAAFERKARQRLNDAAPDDGGSKGYPRRRWVKTLKHILATMRDADAYLEVCEASALTPEDCEVLAGICQRSKRFEEALAWIERGFGLSRRQRYGSGAEYKLKIRQRDLLRRLGRIEEAIAAAWADYQGHPSRAHYEMLMEVVSEEERSRYRDMAMKLAEGAELRSAIELFVEAKEGKRLASRIAAASDLELENLSHTVAEPAAKALRAARPLEAARLYRSVAVGILNAGKSKYYSVALQRLQQARDIFDAAGKADAWMTIVEELRAAHHRKWSFMPGLERIAAGGPARERRPSLVERGRKRWNR